MLLETSKEVTQGAQAGHTLERDQAGHPCSSKLRKRSGRAHRCTRGRDLQMARAGGTPPFHSYVWLVISIFPCRAQRPTGHPHQLMSHLHPKPKNISP
eukprot:395332-Pelagomonas_calceolata.AAC.1